MYNFTDDWFSHNIPNFEKYLSPYKGIKSRFLEIGSYEGRSAVWMLENILTEDSRLICIEPGYSLGNNNVLKQNLSKFNNVTILENTSNNSFGTVAIKYGINSLDFVYVDGSHSYEQCFIDMVHGMILLKSGGIMAIDDYEWPLKDPDGTCPKDAVDQYLRLYENYDLLCKNYQVWIKKK